MATFSKKSQKLLSGRGIRPQNPVCGTFEYHQFSQHAVYMKHEQKFFDICFKPHLFPTYNVLVECLLWYHSYALSGTWSNWDTWSSCSQSCETGVQDRTRSCMGMNCVGNNTQVRVCETQTCPGISEAICQNAFSCFCRNFAIKWLNFNYNVFPDL